MENKKLKIRHVEQEDKAFWFCPDKHFYRKPGYKDAGGFVINIPGYEQPIEMIMVKEVCV